MSKNSFFSILLLLACCNVATAQRLSLFSPELRQSAGRQQVVMDFIERYFYDLQHLKSTTVQTKMADDKVFFRKGTLKDIYNVCDTMPFSINLNDRHYDVSWLRGNDVFVNVVFPAQYDLLMGMNQEQAQQKLRDAVISSSVRDSAIVIPDGLQPYADGVMISKTESFELESLNDATYYSRSNGTVVPVFCDSLPAISAANLFHGLIADSDYRMHVEQSVYGLKTVSYTISFSKWLDYCAEQGLKVFFAIEEERTDGMLAIVIAQSKELGYNHLLSVVIPDKFISDRSAVLKARMTPYIPTHNVKDLYQKQSANRKKQNWK